LNQFGVKETLLIIVLASILVLLYVQSRQASNEMLYQVNSLIYQVSSSDASMERDVLKLNVGQLHHYDSVSNEEKHLYKLFQKLEVYLGSVSELSKPFGDLERSIVIQSESLDSFKRNNALFRNSLRYFSIAVRQGTADRPELQSYLVHIHNDLLQSVAIPESEPLSHMNKYVGELREEGLHALSKHLNLMIERSAKTQASVNAFIHCGVEENAEALLVAYGGYHDTQMVQAEVYRIALVLFSGLLLLYVAFVMYRLHRAATELKEINAELQYQKFALDEHAIVAVTDHQGTITYANNKFCELSGYSEEELVGQNHRILKSGYHTDDFYKNLWQTISSGKVWHGDVKNRSKNGNSYWMNATIVPFLNSEGKPYKYVAIRSDITAWKEAVESEKRLSTAFIYAAEAVMITDEDGVIEHVNLAFEKMTGYSEAEANGEHESMLSSSKHDRVFFEHLVVILKRGNPWKGEVVIRRKDHSERTTHHSVAPVCDEDGKVINHVIFMTDVTEEKTLRSKVEHTQRLESLGVMAGGIAHDFNNILTSILGNAKLAESKMTGGKRGSTPYLERITKASERAADLCRQMLAYSGQGQLEIRVIDLSKLVHDVTSLLEVSVADHVQISYHLTKELPSVEGDSGQLQQVIMNLITNAGESYQGKHGLVEVSAGKMWVDSQWLKDSILGEELKEGEYVYVEVKDSGCGMDEETRKKMFEPFFTTKFTGRGLGMSAMMGIIKAHHGAINIYSELGEGTMIRVIFPPTDQPVELFSPQDSLVEHRVDGAIMVVDDEEDILELAETVLEEMGYHVVTAFSGEGALKLFGSDELNVVAVITDATMPGMSGEQLCRKLRELDKDVKLILSSGYDRDSALSQLPDGVIQGFIQKSYAPEQFSKSVAKILSK